MRRMALLHRAELRPGKLDLLASWLPTRSWSGGPSVAAVTTIATARFDDPAGQVGIETIVVRCGDGPLLHAPLTYRDAPLPGCEEWLVGTAEHSVLGRRYVYDAACDRVYANVLATTILTGAPQAEEFFTIDGQKVIRDPNMSVSGSGRPGADVPVIEKIVGIEDGDPTVIVTDSIVLTIERVLDSGVVGSGVVGSGLLDPGLLDPGLVSNDAGAGYPTLVGTWRAQPTPIVLARVKA